VKAQLTTHDDFVALGMGGRSTGTVGGNRQSMVRVVK
jgi:hypothetical protein